MTAFFKAVLLFSRRQQMKQLLAITASVAILAVAAPFAANQWIEFSGRNATWKEAAALKNLQNEQALSDIRAREQAVSKAAFEQALKEETNKMADEYLGDPSAYLANHRIAYGSAAWKFVRDFARERYAAGDPYPELARRTFDALEAAAINR
jgi:hypothetical protein